MSIGRAPSPPSSTFTARGVTPHGQHLRFSFSMISPSNFVEERAPRLSAMGGRAGCNPDNPLELTTKCRLLAARGSKNAQFLAPRPSVNNTVRAMTWLLVGEWYLRHYGLSLIHI